MKRPLFFLSLSVMVTGAFFYRPSGLPLCSSKFLLGVSCPGCGMLRSVTSFAQGRFADSISYHLFGPLVFATVVTLWGVALVGLVRRRDFRTPNNPSFNSSLGVALVLLLGYWAARMATGTTP